MISTNWELADPRDLPNQTKADPHFVTAKAFQVDTQADEDWYHPNCGARCEDPRHDAYMRARDEEST